MAERRLLELLAILMVGDGLLALLYPRRHLRLWRFGPRVYEEMVDWQIARPTITRLIGAGVLGAGLLLAERQYTEVKRTKGSSQVPGL